MVTLIDSLSHAVYLTKRTGLLFLYMSQLKIESEGRHLW